MNNYHIQVDLVQDCGDTIDYIVCAESEQNALDFVKEDILQNTYSVEDAQKDELEMWSDRLREDKEKYENLCKEHGKETVDKWGNTSNHYVIKKDGKDIFFSWRDLDKNWDFFKDVFLENAKKSTYIYAFENGGTTCKIIQGEGIFHKSSIYHGC